MNRRLFLLTLGSVSSALAAPLPSAVRVDRAYFEAETPQQAREALTRVGSPAFVQRVLFLVPDLVDRLPPGVDRLQWVRERLQAVAHSQTGLQVRIVHCDPEQKRLLAAAVSRVLTTPVSPRERMLLNQLTHNSQSASDNPAAIRRKMIAAQVAANAPVAAVGAEEQEQVQKRNDSVKAELNAKPLRKIR